MQMPIAFLRRSNELAACGLRSENEMVQPFCRQLWIEHFRGNGSLPLGKIWLSSPKQWFRRCANRQQKLKPHTLKIAGVAIQRFHIELRKLRGRSRWERERRCHVLEHAPLHGGKGEK